MANLARPSCDYKVRKGSPRIEWLPEAAGQTFAIGDWLYLVGGKLTLAAAAGNDMGNISPVGRAEAKASGVTDTLMPVMVADEDAEFLFPVYHSTIGSAITAVTDVPSTLPLRNQGGVWCLNKETVGTNNRFLVNEIDSRYPVGETYGLVWAKLIGANRALG